MIARDVDGDATFTGLGIRTPTKPVPMSETVPPAVSVKSRLIPEAISTPTDCWDNSEIPSMESGVPVTKIDPPTGDKSTP